jgi:WD40 repeat protein/formylglycine-generating enzyme required for sulfatase activity/tRNA A-37 threonylcarbamoyl transferase component Bud32
MGPVIMFLASVSDLVRLLRKHHLLAPAQLEEVTRDLSAHFTDPRALAKELLQRGWLTAYQINQVFKGRGADLVLGPYLLLERLGMGGMGTVYKARHRTLGRLAAVKVIRPDLLSQAGAVDRFLREARAAARLLHSNAVLVFDAGAVGATHFFAMQYVEGTDLGRLIQENGPLPVARACDYIRQAALGLQHAHEHGLVHRDIKPDNLILTHESGGAWVVKVLDFGLARFASETAGAGHLTPPTQMIGTPDFIAPEQARDTHAADIRADIFSLGCTLFYLLTGQLPFGGRNYVEKLSARLYGAPRSVRSLRPQVPEALETVLARMLALDPAARYATPAEVAEALEPFTRPEGAAVTPVLDPANEADEPDPSDALTKPHPAAGGLPSPPPGQPVLSPPRRRRWLLPLAVAAGLLLVLAAVVWLALPPPESSGTPEPQPPDTPLAAGPRRDEIVTSLGMTLVRIPPGTFRMGSPPRDPHHGDDEGLHEVEITRPFYLGIHEVTQGQYRQVMGTTPSAFAAGGPQRERVRDVDTGRLPVDSVSWDDAVEFCVLLSAWPEERRRRRVYRLPTEAEWEWAARGGPEADSARPFPSGVTLSSREANFDPGKDSDNGPSLGRPAPVGSYPVNALGLYDMAGNVWEWCADWYDPAYYTRCPRLDPRNDGPGGPGTRALRGGAWNSPGWQCRSANRSAQAPGRRLDCAGFRVVCEIKPAGLPAESPFPPDAVSAWRAARFQPPAELELVLGEYRQRHWGPVTCLTAGADGRTLASCGADFASAGSVRLWDVPPPTENREGLRERRVLPCDVVLEALTLSSDGNYLFGCSKAGQGRRWDLVTGNRADVPLYLPRGLTGTALTAVAAGGSAADRVLGAGVDRVVRLWDARTGKEVRHFEGHTQPIRAVALSPDGRRVLSGGDDKTVRLWDVDSGEEVACFEEHTAPVTSVAFSADGSRAVSASADGAIRLWDMATIRALTSLAGPAPVTRVALSPDGRQVLAVGTEAAPLRVWDVGRTKEIPGRLDRENRALAGHRFPVTAAPDLPPVGGLVVAGDGLRAFSGGVDGTVRQWDLRTGRERVPVDPDGPCAPLAFTADGARFITGSAFGPVRAWEMTTGQAVVGPPWAKENGPVLAIARDGKSLIQSPGRFLDLVTGQARNGRPGERATVAALSPDGRTVAAVEAAAPHLVHLWDLQTGQELPPLEAGPTPVRELAFAPDSRSLVVVLDGKLKLFDWAGRKELSSAEVAVITTAVVPVEPAPGLRYYLAVSTGRRVTLWALNAPGLREMPVAHDFPDTVRALACNRTGQFVAAGTGRGDVRLWSTTANTEPHRWEIPGAVAGLAFSPDGKTVAAGGGNGTVYVFRVGGR